MSDQIIVVTAPDDVQLDATRILLVDLNVEQSQIVSNALLQLENLKNPVISYVWKMGDSVTWLLDKNIKSDVVIFNAEPVQNGASELIIGYIAAQPGSHYFGILRDLQQANNRVIYTSDDILHLLEKTINKNG
jgi:hypothetical protein